MSKIDLAQVEHVAALARLALSEEEKHLLTEQLNHILLYMEKLNELDTTEVEPTSHVLPLKNVLREDVTHPSLRIEEALQNAPEQEHHYIRVPRVVDS